MKKPTDKEMFDWLEKRFRSLYFSAGTQKWFLEGRCNFPKKKARQAIRNAMKQEG